MYRKPVENLYKLLAKEPVKWNFVVQTLETKTIRATFKNKGKVETLRLASQKRSMKDREEAIVGLLEGTWVMKNSTFSHVNEEFLKSKLQVKYS